MMNSLFFYLGTVIVCVVFPGLVFADSSLEGTEPPRIYPEIAFPSPPLPIGEVEIPSRIDDASFRLSVRYSSVDDAACVHLETTAFGDFYDSDEACFEIIDGVDGVEVGEEVDPATPGSYELKYRGTGLFAWLFVEDNYVAMRYPKNAVEERAVLQETNQDLIAYNALNFQQALQVIKQQSVQYIPDFAPTAGTTSSAPGFGPPRAFSGNPLDEAFEELIQRSLRSLGRDKARLLARAFRSKSLSGKALVVERLIKKLIAQARLGRDVDLLHLLQLATGLREAVVRALPDYQSHVASRIALLNLKEVIDEAIRYLKNETGLDLLEEFLRRGRFF